MSWQNLHLRGMGTTVCALFFHDEGLIVAHVGDSRIYRLRDGQLRRLTHDHSMVAEMAPDQLEAMNEKERKMIGNIVTRSMGSEPQVTPTLSINDIAPGDLYLMCTDGLTDMLSDDLIEEVLNNKQDLPQLGQALVDCALDRGGLDNVTALLVKVD